ncbi:hypothetical protein [Burkholderia sp. S171]|jgi:hypothetical protein|uniref:hypothetical protein n=1 Tax=Burkholderia sp. S171 TaxID=1641860 RepID=UPI00131A65A7|nr:hypothetical protein [Burkholderia sp. S171]
MSKTNAYVEHRPLASEKGAAPTHHVVIVDNKEVKSVITQKEAADWAVSMNYAVHVARERHLLDRATPAHWRAYP